jgi:hypothetical protein
MIFVKLLQKSYNYKLVTIYTSMICHLQGGHLAYTYTSLILLHAKSHLKLIIYSKMIIKSEHSRHMWEERIFPIGRVVILDVWKGLDVLDGQTCSFNILTYWTYSLNILLRYLEYIWICSNMLKYFFIKWTWGLKDRPDGWAVHTDI